MTTQGPNLHVSSLATLTESQKSDFIAHLTDDEVKALIYEWEFWARPKQLAPEWEWATWLIRSGRGFGKTRTGSEFIRKTAKQGPFFPMALIGKTVADVRDVMVDGGESSIIKCSPPWFMPKYEWGRRRVIWPNGMIAYTYSGDQPDQLRGPQHGTLWADEIAKWRYPKECWDNAMLGLRLGPTPRAVVTTTPRPIPIIRDLLKDPLTADVSGSSYENAANLSPIFIKRIKQLYEGTRLGQQEIFGLVNDDVPGSLWHRDDIENNRVSMAPDLSRIVVGVDPEATSGEESAETGIVIAGVTENGQGYILDDYTIRGTPNEWAMQVHKAYTDFFADRIIAESNNGGQMVENTLRTLRDKNDHKIGQLLPITLVWASRGKYTRAEPVSALYEQGRIHHVGMFAELEDQMCNWLPGGQEPSPDRMDALVWALTWLLVGKEPGQWGNV